MVDPALAAAPQEVLDEARLRFQEIAEGLDGVPEDSAFWASVRVSQLCLAVHGWSCFYTVDAERLHVTGVRGR
jgi:hypothetical protein